MKRPVDVGAWKLESLPWLLPTPEDFTANLKAVAGGGTVDGLRLRELANHALDLNRLIQLDRVMDRLGDRLGDDLVPGALSQVRLAVLADATAEFSAPAIRASALRHGVLATLYVPDYGQGMQEVLEPGSGLAKFGADAALIAQDYRSLGLAEVEMDPTVADTRVSSAIELTRNLINGLSRLGARSIILQTLPVPPEPWCGHFDRRAPGSVAAQIAAYNQGLLTLADDHEAVVLDVACLADTVGRSRWFDHVHWHRAKLPFAMDLIPLYADHVARILGALRGKARKCLVLDLDNTIWGGVIGDDGIDGIRIGQGSPDGEAYLAVQAYARQLNRRGIVLAVCSKNEDDTARLPFREHPDMLLRERDIAVFLANWTDKASNIQHIAKTLNIGLDALALLEDNPAERARVRQMLPEVAVPELPEDPAWYPAALAHAGYFETLGLSAEDAKRADQYRANASRTTALQSMGDYETYLASLDMACDIRSFDSVGRTRIAQLINKTNQFNLTTRRYSEAEVAALQADPDIFTLQIRLADRFGDNGMISVVIFRKGGEEWLCDTWLMSCRVLGRRVEEAALAAVASAARAAGAKRLIGEYFPTAKNQMVREQFAKLGFVKDGPAGEEGTRWVLDLGSYRPPDLPMRIQLDCPAGSVAETASVTGQANA